MQKSLDLDPNQCTGCLQCEMACSWENYRSFTTAKSRIKVFTFHHEGRFVPYTCTQCDEAWCMVACPVDAIQHDRRPARRSCSTPRASAARCARSPAPSALSTTSPRRARSQKCDLCDGAPACATACPTGAITYIDADWTGLGKMRQWAGKTDTNVATV